MNPHAPKDQDARRAFLTATELDPLTQARLRHRLSQRSSSGGAGWRWGFAVAGVALAVGLVVVALMRPSSVVQPPEGPDVASAWPHEHVKLDFDGEGRTGGTREAPIVVWEAGTVDVEVEPEQGVNLTVTTEEATVEVIGTAFQVTRESLATEVRVAHGHVAVTCVGQPPRSLRDGDRWVCLPDDLPSLLRRVTALTRSGASSEARLRTIDHAWPRSEAHPTVRGELLAHRITALRDAGRDSESVEVAETYLGEGHRPRRAEFLSLVAHARYADAGCAAQPELERAVDELPAGPEALLLARCLVTEEPARARALVDAAEPQVDAAWQEVVAQLRAALDAGAR